MKRQGANVQRAKVRRWPVISENAFLQMAEPKHRHAMTRQCCAQLRAWFTSLGVICIPVGVSVIHWGAAAVLDVAV